MTSEFGRSTLRLDEKGNKQVYHFIWSISSTFFSVHSNTILVVPGSSQKREHECAGDGWEVWLKLTSVCMWFERIHISITSEP